MDIEKCQTLLCVLEEGSLSAAADKLGYTPSGISRMIAALEQDAGFPLLVRSRRGITPTAECRELLRTFQEISYWGRQYTELSAQIRGIEVGEIRIGTSYRAYYSWLTKLIADFSGMHPGISIHMKEENSSMLVQAMKEHQLDLCIISRREGDFSWVPLKDNPMVAWIPADHSLAAAGSFPLSAFESEPYIETFPGEDTDNARVFKSNNIRPNIRYSTTDNYATYSMVEAGLGISLNNGLSVENWNGDVVIKPLDPPQSVMIGLATPSTEELSPAAKKFVQYAEKHFSRIENIVAKRYREQ